MVEYVSDARRKMDGGCMQAGLKCVEHVQDLLLGASAFGFPCLACVKYVIIFFLSQHSALVIGFS